ncbi:MAG TPA: hypothetical protein VF290_14020 [Pyrinomonadaceae bacterium]
MTPTTVSSPYLGLMPYDDLSAKFFFGREPEIQLLTASMFAYRLTIAYGPTGVGKSSILNAGVRSFWAGRGDLLFVICNRWQHDPIAAIKVAAADAAAQEVEDFRSPDMRAPLDRFLAAIGRDSERRVMVVLDQFEEFFLYHSQDKTFSSELRAATLSPDAAVSVLISLREETVGKLERFRVDLPELLDHIVYINPLGRDAAREAIEKPLGVYNLSHAPAITIEPELVETVLDQVEAGRVEVGDRGRTRHTQEDRNHPIEAPYLQMVMMRLWDEERAAKSATLRLQTLDRLGGVDYIVVTHLDRVMAGLPETDQRVAAGAFAYLVTPSGSKIAHTVSDLAAYTDMEGAALEQVLDKLTEQRIIRSVPPPPNMPDDLRYEIFHDMLGPSVLDWRERYWRAEEAERERRQADEERRRAAAEARVAEQARSARRLKSLIAIASVLLIMVAGTAAFAVLKEREARASESRALDSEANAQRLRQISEGQTLLANSKTLEAEKQAAIAAMALLNAEKEAAQARKLLTVATDASKSAEILKHRAHELSKVSKLLLEGFSLKEDHEIDAASKKYMEALEIAEVIGDRDRQAQILRSLALVWEEKKDALESYESALRIYRADGDHKKQADTLREMGDLFRYDTNEWRKGAPYYENALSLYVQQKRRTDEIITLEKLARLLRYHPDRTPSEAQQSIQLYEKVLSFYNADHNTEGTAETLKMLGWVHASLQAEQRKRAEKLVEFHRRAADVYHRAHDFDEEASTIQSMMAFIYDLNDPVWLIDLHKQQSEAYSAAGKWEYVAKNIAAIARIMHTDLQKTQEALNYLEEARKRFHEASQRTEEGVILAVIGHLHWLSHFRPRAIDYYKQAAALFHAANNPVQEASAEASIAQIWNELEDTVRAIEHYEKARALFTQTHNEQPWVLHQLIFLYRQVGQSGKAEEIQKQLDASRGRKP